MRQDGVAVLDVIELAQDRLDRPTNRVLVEPLQVSNPDHHGSKLLRVNVRFQPEELLRVNLLFNEGGLAVFGGKDARLVPQIEHSPQRQIEEISAAASGI